MTTKKSITDSTKQPVAPWKVTYQDHPQAKIFCQNQEVFTEQNHLMNNSKDIIKQTNKN